MSGLPRILWITTLLYTLFTPIRADVITDDFLLFGESGVESIWQLSTDGSQRNLVVAGPEVNSNPPSHVTSLDYSPDDETVYWVDQGAAAIKSATLNGSDVTDILSGTDAVSVAVDPVSRVLFYVNGSRGSINLYQLDTHHHIVILQADAHIIKLDPVRRMIYWVETSGTIIEMCEYDGANRRVVVLQPGAQINALVLDLPARRMFWSEGENNTIQVADMETGKNMQQVIPVPATGSSSSSSGSGSGSSTPAVQQGYFFGVAVDESYLYYVDWLSGTIYRAEKNTGESVTPISSQQFQPMNALLAYSTINYVSGRPSDCVDKNGGCAEYCIPTSSGVTCRCSQGATLNADNKTCTKVGDVPGPDLIWLEHDGFSTGYIRGVPGDPLLYLNSGQLNIWSIEHHAWQWTALDFNYQQQKLYLADKQDRLIVSMTLEEEHDIQVLYYGTSQEVNGIAVDWMSNNIYWTDAHYNWIMILRLKGLHVLTKVLIRTGLDQPHAIAVHPAKGLMFWTDWGIQDRIEVAQMDGTNRSTLVDTYLTDPMGLAIDYVNDRVFWSNRDSIESVGLDGSDRRTYVTHAGTNFVGLSYYNTYIFATTRGEAGVDPHVWFYSSNHTDQNGEKISLVRRPYAITMYHADRQPQDSKSECADNNGWCDHFCVPPGPGLRECLCADNYKLDDDSITCVESEMISTSSYVYSVGDRLCSSSIRTATSARIDQKSSCFFHPTHVQYRFHALDFNHYTGDIYFSETLSKVPTIRRANYKYQVDNEPLFYGTGIVNGIAYDWLNDLIYWTDSTHRTISVANGDKSYQKTLTTLDNIPHAIAVDPISEYIYWTELSPDVNDPLNKARIMKAPQDLAQLYSIVHEDLVSPTGLAIDYVRQRLVWVDNMTGKIESVEFNGRNRQVLPINIDSTDSVPYDVAIIQDYVAVSVQVVGSATPSAGLRLFEYVTGAEVENGIFEEGQNVSAYGVIAMDPGNQPFINHGPTSCSSGADGCEQLCLPSSYTYQCACMNGMVLAGDRRTCVPKFHLSENFHLVADDYSHMIFQTTDDASAVSAIHFPPFDRPIALAFDVTQHMVYWSNFDKGQIRRLKIGEDTAEQVQTIIEYKNITGARIDGLVFEATSHILYYADLGRNLVAIVNPNGEYQKILVQEDLIKPRTILLDSTHGHMYVGHQGKIERFDMDGINRHLVTTVRGWASGMAIDYIEERIYWCDQVAETIEVADLMPDETTGENNRKILLNLTSTADPFSLLLHGDYLYWTDWSERGLSRMLKTGGATVEKVLTATLIGSNDILHISTADAMTVETMCSNNNGGCSHFCIPTPGGRTCACPDNDHGPVIPVGQDCADVATCPLALANGLWSSGCSGAVGRACTYTCWPGFAPITLAAINCTMIGMQWSINTDTLCTDAACPLLVTPDYALADGNCPPLAGVGTTCYHTCSSGHRMVGGSARRSCIKSETGGPPKWTGTPIECVSIAENPQAPRTAGSSSGQLNKMIGLGIATILIAMLLVAIIIFALRRRRLKMEEDAEETSSASRANDSFPETLAINGVMDAPQQSYDSTTNNGGGIDSLAFENPGYISHNSLPRNTPRNVDKTSKNHEKRPLPSIETARQTSFENPMFGDGGASGYDEHVYETLPGDDKVKLTE